MADKRLDETIPGGWYIGADGKPHDADGQPRDAADAPLLEPAADETPAADAPARKKKA